MPSARSVLGGVVLLGVLVAGIAALSYAITSRQPKVYLAAATVRFETEHPELQLLGLQQVIAPDDRQIQTDTMVAGSPPVVNGAAQALGVSPEEVRSNVALSPATGANAVVMQFTGSTPQKAFRLANDYVQALVTARRRMIYNHAQIVVRELRNQILKLEGNHPNLAHPFTTNMHVAVAAQRSLQQVGFGVPQVVKAPILPTSPASPHTQRNTLFGALFGALLAVALISLLFRSSRRRSNGPPLSGDGKAVESTGQLATAEVPAVDDDWHRRP